MAATPTYQPTVSPVDALWALYQSQSKKVRKAFRQKLQEEEKSQSRQGAARDGKRKHDKSLRRITLWESKAQCQEPF